MFDQTSICSIFSSIINFSVFDTNKLDEKFQSFAFVAEKKSEIFDLHREFLKNFDFDDKIESVAITKMKKIIISRDLTNRKLTKLLKTFFFLDTQKAFFFTKKNVFDFLNIYDELCAEHEIFDKKKLNVRINIILSLSLCLFRLLLSEITLNEKKYASYCVKNIKIKISSKKLLFSTI